MIKVNQLGDSVVGLPLVGVLVEELGRENVFVVSTPIAAGLYEGLIPSENMLIMERTIFNSAWKRPVFLFRIWKFLVKSRPDFLFNPFDQGYVARALGLLVRCKKRFSMSNPQVRFSGIGYEVVPFDESLNMHENNWKLLVESVQQMGIASRQRFPPSPRKYLLEEGREISKTGKSVIIHPGSSRASTQWAHSDFVALANRLSLCDYEVTWMLEGTRPSELSHKVVALPRASLKEFIATLNRFDIFVGNNSGPMHLADVVGLKLVVIPGPAAIGWDPYWASEKHLLRVPGLQCQPCEVLGQPKLGCSFAAEAYACQRRISVENVYSSILSF